MEATENEKEWWTTLNDDEKLKAYLGMKAANSSHANALHEIVDHLLGSDWYCMPMDIYGCNQDIVAAIKSNYPDVNYSWSKTWKRITNVLHDHFHR